MKIHKLHEIIFASYYRPDDEDYREKNVEAFTELIRFLDNRCLSFIMREFP